MDARKVVTSLVGLTLAVTLTACGNQPTAKAPAGSSANDGETVEQETTTTEIDFDGSSQSETGEGTVILSTEAGTSEDGNIPKMTIPADTVLTQVEIDTVDLNASAVTYVYVDGLESTKGNMGESQNVIDLSGDALKAGNHIVEVVQFENDDPAGTVTLYRKMEYEIAN